MINDVLDMSKIEAGKLELRPVETKIRDVCQSVLRMLTPLAAAKAIDLGADLPEAPVGALADEHALRQVLVNILGNAIKFTPRCGAVRLRLETAPVGVGRHAAGVGVGRHAAAEGEDILITVTDSGPGMPGELVARIGQPFLQSADRNASREGSTGLGLVITKALVEAHGGSFEVESELGKGTIVRVRLPRRGNAGG